MEKPAIRILQRPCPVSDNKASEATRPPATVKTLEQREADYAAARRRIMGSDSPEPDGNEIQPSKGSLKSTPGNGNSTPRQVSTSLTGVTTSATPLMSIQAVPVTSNGLNCDMGFSSATTTSSGANVQPRTALNARQGLAVVNVAQKLQQHQPQSTQNATHSVMQQNQQHQASQSRILTASASSPSILAQSHHASHAQPVPLFPSQLGNNVHAGLLPTPPSAFNYPMHHTTSMTGHTNGSGGGGGGGGLLHSHSAALALMHQFNLFQPQYQQTMNGLQHQLLTSTVAPTNTSFNHFNFSSVNSQSNTAQKHAHPSAFN